MLKIDLTREEYNELIDKLMLNEFQKRILEYRIKDFSIVEMSILDNRLMARDTFNVNTNLLDTKYALGTEIVNNRYQAQLGDCGLSKEIMQNRYDNALQTQTLSSQMNECCLNYA